MRSNEIFAAMTGEEALRFLERMKQEAPPVANLALGSAANAFRLRGEFLRRQPKERQAEWMRRALGRTIGAELAEEVLATYFLDHKKELLVEFLDALGVAHEEGRLSEHEPAAPDPKQLKRGVEAFRKGDDPETRDLLLRAFAGQASINWPDLEGLLAELPPPPKPARRRKRSAKKPARAKKAKAGPAKAKGARAKAKRTRSKKG